MPGACFDVPQYHRPGSFHVLWLPSDLENGSFVAVRRHYEGVGVLLYCLYRLTFQTHHEPDHAVRHGDLDHDITLTTYRLVGVRPPAGLVVVAGGADVREMLGRVLNLFYDLEDSFLLSCHDKYGRLRPHGCLDVRVCPGPQVFDLAS